ncbi:MAG TPA: ATP-binding protein [Burkholderiales bacterium]
MKNRSAAPDQDPLCERARRLGLFGLVQSWDELGKAPWVTQLIELEETERQKRSLERRLKHAKIGRFKPMVDFDWNWPRAIDRAAIDELFSLDFVAEGSNAILLGPNGVGKSMILKNLAHQALLRGFTVRFTSASTMLADLAAQDSPSALARRLSRYCLPRLLCVDEVGYLSYNNRYADLFFEVVSRRYNTPASIVISTNKPFAEWSEVFPHAACVVTLVDRLIHHAELITIEGDSYRLKEAKERAAKKPRRHSHDSAHQHHRP